MFCRLLTAFYQTIFTLCFLQLAQEMLTPPPPQQPKRHHYNSEHRCFHNWCNSGQKRAYFHSLWLFQLAKHIFKSYSLSIAQSVQLRPWLNQLPFLQDTTWTSWGSSSQMLGTSEDRAHSPALSWAAGVRTRSWELVHPHPCHPDCSKAGQLASRHVDQLLAAALRRFTHELFLALPALPCREGAALTPSQGCSRSGTSQSFT